MKRAKIVGQAASGVPLWRCDEATSKWTGIRKTPLTRFGLKACTDSDVPAYVVFPGNVGERETLRDLVASWSKVEQPSPAPMQYQR